MPGILITGASGFVGRKLAEAERERGKKVAGIHHPAENPDVEFASEGIDLRDTARLVDFINQIKPDKVYHLAALSSVRACQENPVLCFDTNVTGTLNLLDIISKLNYKPRILFTSSAEVYGQVPHDVLPATENIEPAPVNTYGLSKLKAEDICRFFWITHQLPVMITRSFNHTGAGQSQRFVFPHVANTLARIEAGLEEPELQMGNLSVKRDFLDVRDVIEAYMSIVDKGQPGQVYNVTSGSCISIEEGVRMLVEISGIKVNILQAESRMRSYDIPVMSGDASRVKNYLGWQSRISLEKMFADLLDFWRAKEGVL